MLVKTPQVIKKVNEFPAKKQSAPRRPERVAAVYPGVAVVHPGAVRPARPPARPPTRPPARPPAWPTAASLQTILQATLRRNRGRRRRRRWRRRRKREERLQPGLQRQEQTPPKRFTLQEVCLAWVIRFAHQLFSSTAKTTARTTAPYSSPAPTDSTASTAWPLQPGVPRPTPRSASHLTDNPPTRACDQTKTSSSVSTAWPLKLPQPGLCSPASTA